MAEKIKVAFLLTPIDFAGAEKVSLNLLQNIDRAIFEIFPIVLIRPWEKNNLFIKFLKTEKYFFFKVPVADRPPEEGRNYFRVAKCFKTVYSILKKLNCHLLHTNGYFADLIGIPCAIKLKIACTATCHGFVPIDKKLKFYGFLDRLILRHCTKIIAVSEELKKELVKSRISENKIRIIQNAVPQSYPSEIFQSSRISQREMLGISSEQLVIGYVGRLSKEKGVNYLIEACTNIRANNIPFQLIIVGEGPEKPKLEEKARKNGVIENVYFAGFQNDIENWLSALDIFILPSLTEGTPMALLEAMSVNLPVIASAVGGVPKIIENKKNGILVTPANPDQIADALIKLYKNDELRLKIARKAAETITNRFSINQWVDKIESVYLDIIENKACT